MSVAPGSISQDVAELLRRTAEGWTMSNQEPAPRTMQGTDRLEEKSLLGSAYSFHDIGQMSAQSLSDLQADDSDD
jgi:hypothetical protein